MKVQDKIKWWADGLCLALCYMELFGIKNDEDKLKIASEALRQGFIDWTGIVQNPIGLARLCGHTEVKDVRKVTTYDGHDTVIAYYTNNNYGHFVLVKDGEVVWNSLEKSVCVEKGHIDSYRIIITN